jgi:hypothetical protein
MTTTALVRSINKNMKDGSKILGCFSENWDKVCFVGFILCSLLLFFYIYQINILTSGTYLISKNKSSIGEISKENKELEVLFAENNYLEKILSRIEDSDFQKTVSIKYIQIMDNSLANAK